MTLPTLTLTPLIATPGTPGFLSISLYSVKDPVYGAKGDGSADDTAAIQAAITACINGGGGIVYMPAGTYKTTGTLDFSALDGTLTQLTFKGAGAGGAVLSGSPRGTTKLVYSGSGIPLKAYGSSSSAGIYGLRFEGFTLSCTANIGTNYAIDWVGVVAMGGLRDIVVQGAGTGTDGAGGVRICNAFNGQLTLENVVVANFKNGDGFRVSAETVGGFAAINSGNVTLISCLANTCNNGFHLTASGNLLNSCTLVTPKATNNLNYGYLIDGAYSALHTILSPHSESDVAGGYYIDGEAGVALHSPFCEGGSNADGLSCITIHGSVAKTSVYDAVLQNHQYGITFDACTDCWASMRTQTAFGSPAVATKFRNINGATGNTFIDQGSGEGDVWLQNVVLGGALWLRAGTGAPAAGLGSQGDFYFRQDGGASTHIYFKSGASTWTAIA